MISFDYAQDRLFGRVFARIDPNEFRRCFLSWVHAIGKLTHRQVVAIDGKKLRRSHDRCLGKKAITMVSAWATANHLVLGQRKVTLRYLAEMKAVTFDCSLIMSTVNVALVSATGIVTLDGTVAADRSDDRPPYRSRSPTVSGW